jgi:hypothetical protein
LSLRADAAPRALRISPREWAGIPLAHRLQTPEGQSIDPIENQSSEENS